LNRLGRIAVILLAILSLSLQGCVSAVAGLKSYIDTTDGYEFLYPNGWVQVQVTAGPDVVLHDLIEQSENVSVIISPVPDSKTLEELGSPSEVGYRLSKNAIAPPNSGREAELVNAESRQIGDEDYYILEYIVKLPDQIRHNLASVAVRRGKLFTMNLSATDRRWEKMKDQFYQVVTSFHVY